MSEPSVSPLILRYCKHGHLRTEESTFPRKARVGGKDYIVRECRICHSMRNIRAPTWSKGQSNSKWRRYETATAQGIETRSAIDAKRRGPKGESPVREANAPNPPPYPSTD